MAESRSLAPRGAAECARHTGVTAGALRVDDRYGLMEPERDAKGWRRYRPRELEPLSVIVTLKAFGMTWTQIRALLNARSAPAMYFLSIREIDARTTGPWAYLASALRRRVAAPLDC